jgi:N-acetylneuraminic acid mutarotase
MSFCPKELSPNTTVSNWIDSYDPSNNAWRRRLTSIPELPQNHVLKSFSMVAIADNIYVIGGRLCHKIAGGDETVEVDVEIRLSVLCYNVRDDVWSKRAPMRVPRFDFACTVCDGKIYVAGGKTTLGSARGVSSAEVYDPALDQWKALPSMNAERYKCVAVTWRGKVHVFGGFAGRSSGDSWYTKERSSAEVYDAEIKKWDLIVGMWQLDVPPNQIVAVDDTLFSSGDCLNAWKGHVEAYDGKLNIWNVVDRSYRQNLSYSIATLGDRVANWGHVERFYLTMAAIGTHLYFLTGYKKPGEISKLMSVVHMFDTSEDLKGFGWSSFEPTEEEEEKELCSHCGVANIN